MVAEVILNVSVVKTPVPKLPFEIGMASDLTQLSFLGCAYTAVDIIIVSSS